MGMKAISFSIRVLCLLFVLIYAVLYYNIWKGNLSTIPSGIFWPPDQVDQTETDMSDPFMEFCTKSDSGNGLLKAKCGYVFRQDFGGLGNQMFEYASFYGMVKNQNQSMDGNGKKIAFVYEMKELEEAFDDLPMYHSHIKTSCMEGRVDVTIRESGCCVFDPIGQLPCDGKNYYIRGYRQNFKYFAHVKEELLREFSNFREPRKNFREPIKEKCDQLLKNIFHSKKIDRQNSMTVAIHLRRGDFVELAHYHSPASIDYLKRAIKFFEDIFTNKVQVTPRLKHLVFVIFGDDPDWNSQAIEQVQISNPNITHSIVISGKSRSVDLCAMSKCDHIAISTGTFGIWGAFLNPGIVTYQKEYAGSEIRGMTDDDFWMPDWIPL